jgi:hypothetical protein
MLELYVDGKLISSWMLGADIPDCAIRYCTIKDDVDVAVVESLVCWYCSGECVLKYSKLVD